MNSLTAARAQMELSLGFHIIFSALGIGMPLLMVIAEGLGLRTGKPHYKAIAQMWGKATGLLFVIGAVSGTALSFELGLLWPRLMAFAGPSIGPAFALEGYAFFLEAIFVGLYLYGWERMSPRAHWLTGIPVAASGMMSGVLVVAGNAWMQHPVGVGHVVDGVPTEVDAAAVFSAEPWLQMALHATLASYAAVGFSVAGVYAIARLRNTAHRSAEYTESAMRIALAVGIVAALLQPLSGHITTQSVTHAQPIKLAAIEAHFETSKDAPIILGGLADATNHRVRFGITIPYGLSLLAYDDPHAIVRGLDDFPVDEWPNIALCHLAFDTMVGSGMAMALVAVVVAWSAWRARRKKTEWRESTFILRAIAITSPLGFVAIEGGWVVTEAGRQPWAVYGLLRTRDAVTPVDSVVATFWCFAALYAILAIALVVLLRALGRHPASVGQQ